MKTSSAKAKGRKLQQLVRDKIIEVFKLDPEDCKSTSMGASGVDIQLSSSAYQKFPYAVECKSRAKISIYEMWEQATANKGKYDPLLIIKANNKKPLAVIDLDEFMDLAFYKNAYFEKSR